MIVTFLESVQGALCDSDLESRSSVVRGEVICVLVVKSSEILSVGSRDLNESLGLAVVGNEGNDDRGRLADEGSELKVDLGGLEGIRG